MGLSAGRETVEQMSIEVISSCQDRSLYSETKEVTITGIHARRKEQSLLALTKMIKQNMRRKWGKQSQRPP